MSLFAVVAILAAAVAAGAINAVVGSGSLITFPTLLAFGYPPVVANVSNNIGVIPGNVSASFGYRKELTGQRGRLTPLALASFAGALTGAIALLALPAGVFKLVVPVLIIAGCVLVVLQPQLSAWIAKRNQDRASAAAGSAADAGAEVGIQADADAAAGSAAGAGAAAGSAAEADGAAGSAADVDAAAGSVAGSSAGADAAAGSAAGSSAGADAAAGSAADAGIWAAGGARPERSPVLLAAVFLTGVYGGYFGAAQGVILVGLLGVFVSDSLQRINAGKNVLVTIVNTTAAVIFMIFAHVAWAAVGLIAVGSAAGGLIGARIGRRLPPLALRIIIVIIGVISAVKLIFFP
jgi:uncharacterized membrane protein YfcA